MNTTIYNPDVKAHSFPTGEIPDWQTIRSCRRIFQPAWIARYESETQWVELPPETPRPMVTPEQAERIGLDKERCPRCLGNFHYRVTKRGTNTGITITAAKDCPCALFRRFWPQWDKILLRFRDAAPVMELTPANKSSLPFDQQQRIIDTVQADPNRGYFLYGKGGTGKTHMAASLYRHHLMRWAQRSDDKNIERCVWRVSAPNLMKQHVAASTDKEAKRPELTVEMILNAARRGQRPVLFLDELDKIKPSEFQLETIRSLIDVVYEAEGQVVATSNDTPDQLAAKWGEGWVIILLRRIMPAPEGMAIHFQAGQ